MDNDETFSFVVEWFDDIAEISRDYSLTFWPKDNSVSMFDLKRRRMFLKRMVIESVRLQDLFVGQNVVILSRQLLIKDYGDSSTRKFFVDQMKSAIILCHGQDPFATMTQLLTDIPSDIKIFSLRSIRVEPKLAQFAGDIPSSSTVAAASLSGQHASEFAEEWHAQHREGAVLFENTDEAQAYIFHDAPTSASITNCTLCVLKPHLVSSGHAGPLINKILNSGFTIDAIQMFQLSPQAAEQFYDVYKGVVKQYSDILLEFLTGPVIALEVTKPVDENVESQTQPDVVSDFRQLVGPHDPHVAKHIRGHTLRAEFGFTRVQNAVHATDLPEDGVLECEYFFRTLQQ